MAGLSNKMEEIFAQNLWNIITLKFFKCTYEDFVKNSL